ncbi:hypothetical protein BJ742DRAFT_36082 [Cladochytrium replicatum]|nr:hypothetical protein BJ742DRAFT_36082 [Cladochytrium replicatum]
MASAIQFGPGASASASLPSSQPSPPDFSLGSDLDVRIESLRPHLVLVFPHNSPDHGTYLGEPPRYLPAGASRLPEPIQHINPTMHAAQHQQQITKPNAPDKSSGQFTHVSKEHLRPESHSASAPSAGQRPRSISRGGREIQSRIRPASPGREEYSSLHAQLAKLPQPIKIDGMPSLEQFRALKIGLFPLPGARNARTVAESGEKRLYVEVDNPTVESMDEDTHLTLIGTSAEISEATKVDNMGTLPVPSNPTSPQKPLQSDTPSIPAAPPTNVAAPEEHSASAVDSTTPVLPKPKIKLTMKGIQKLKSAQIFEEGPPNAAAAAPVPPPPERRSKLKVLRENKEPPSASASAKSKTTNVDRHESDGPKDSAVPKRRREPTDSTEAKGKDEPSQKSDMSSHAKRPKMRKEEKIGATDAADTPARPPDSEKSKSTTQKEKQMKPKPERDSFRKADPEQSIRVQSEAPPKNPKIKPAPEQAEPNKKKKIRVEALSSVGDIWDSGGDDGSDRPPSKSGTAKEPGSDDAARLKKRKRADSGVGSVRASRNDGGDGNKSDSEEHRRKVPSKQKPADAGSIFDQPSKPAKRPANEVSDHKSDTVRKHKESSLPEHKSKAAKRRRSPSPPADGTNPPPPPPDSAKLKRGEKSSPKLSVGASSKSATARSREDHSPVVPPPRSSSKTDPDHDVKLSSKNKLALSIKSQDDPEQNSHDRESKDPLPPVTAPSQPNKHHNDEDFVARLHNPESDSKGRGNDRDRDRVRRVSDDSNSSKDAERDDSRRESREGNSNSRRDRARNDSNRSRDGSGGRERGDRKGYRDSRRGGRDRNQDERSRSRSRSVGRRGSYSHDSGRRRRSPSSSRSRSASPADSRAVWSPSPRQSAATNSRRRSRSPARTGKDARRSPAEIFVKERGQDSTSTPSDDARKSNSNSEGSVERRDRQTDRDRNNNNNNNSISNAPLKKEHIESADQQLRKQSSSSSLTPNRTSASDSADRAPSSGKKLSLGEYKSKRGGSEGLSTDTLTVKTEALVTREPGQHSAADASSQPSFSEPPATPQQGTAPDGKAKSANSASNRPSYPKLGHLHKHMGDQLRNQSDAQSQILSCLHYFASLLNCALFIHECESSVEMTRMYKTMTSLFVFVKNGFERQKLRGLAGLSVRLDAVLSQKLALAQGATNRREFSAVRTQLKDNSRPTTSASTEGDSSSGGTVIDEKTKATVLAVISRGMQMIDDQQLVLKKWKEAEAMCSRLEDEFEVPRKFPPVTPYSSVDSVVQLARACVDELVDQHKHQFVWFELN